MLKQEIKNIKLNYPTPKQYLEIKAGRIGICRSIVSDAIFKGVLLIYASYLY